MLGLIALSKSAWQILLRVYQFRNIAQNQMDSIRLVRFHYHRKQTNMEQQTPSQQSQHLLALTV